MSKKPVVPRSLRAVAVGLVLGFAGALLVGFAIQVHETHSPRSADPSVMTTTTAPPTTTPRQEPRDRVLMVSIPGTVSGFAARTAWIYLPPDYRTARPSVLVLLAGQPGSPSDWFHGGTLAATMDAYAAAHHGAAPVVVVPDDLGPGKVNPGCVDGAHGHVATYLDVDVVHWVEKHLRVNDDPAHWAIGGASDGGTCALRTGLRDPGRYPTVLDIAGSQEPIAAIGAHPSPLLAVLVTASTKDAVYTPQQRRVAWALAGAGVPVEFRLLSGPHGWVTFRPALQQALPWLATRMHFA